MPVLESVGRIGNPSHAGTGINRLVGQTLSSMALAKSRGDAGFHIRALGLAVPGTTGVGRVVELADQFHRT
jgi:hypothetical protein